MPQRVIGDKIEINYDEILKFFEERGTKTDLKYLYNRTMYQDNNPDLVIQRDQYEKARITKLLNFNSTDIVLDIGCGVGRWGEEILNKDASYVGIDFSHNLLSLADKNLARLNKGSYDLINCSFQELVLNIKKSKVKTSFNKVVITAVLIYLNDKDIIQSLNNLQELLSPNCLIYLKESMAANERLTLNRCYSEELKSEYDAIYRTKSEYEEMLQKTLLKCGFEIIKEDYLYPLELGNRKETSQYFFILKRKHL